MYGFQGGFGAGLVCVCGVSVRLHPLRLFYPPPLFHQTQFERRKKVKSSKFQRLYQPKPLHEKEHSKVMQLSNRQKQACIYSPDTLILQKAFFNIKSSFLHLVFLKHSSLLCHVFSSSSELSLQTRTRRPGVIYLTNEFCIVFKIHILAL